MKEEPAKAWQPFTFGGVARYGHDSIGRLLFACLVMAVLTAAVVLWTVSRAWLPAIEEAITRLPQGAELRAGKLTAPQPLQLAETLFLSVRLDPRGEGIPPSLADIQVVLAPRDIRFRSIFGMTALAYRPEWTLQLSRADMEPKWAAWRPAVLANLFFGTFGIVVATWIAFGILYAVPVRILAAMLRRAVSLWGSWKLCVAGLLPAAFLMTVAIAVYGLGQIRATELVAAWALHFVTGWIFIIAATLRLPRWQAIPNPFGEDEIEDAEPQPAPVARNPFKARGQKK